METEKHLDCLDGFRGFAALWVLMSHSLIFTGTSIPVLHRGDAAVNLFIIMSGFLMTYHAFNRQTIEPWESRKTWWKFYIRRFFRIAPLYYFMLFIAIILGGILYQFSQIIGHYYPLVAQSENRYLLSGMNILMHFTFLFGFFPQFASKTPLPDWSIGLEMQFYLVFPLLMLLLRKKNYLFFAFILSMAGYLLHKFLIKDSFGQPAFLPLRIQFFVVGILLATAYYYKYSDKKTSIYLIILALIASALVYDRLTLGFTILIALSLFYDKVRDVIRIRPVVSFLQRMLSGKMSKIMAELSYSVYLIHFIVLYPIGLILIKFPQFIALPGVVRFLIIFCCAAIVTYSLAYFTYKFIEQRGIQLGKLIVSRI